MVLTKAEWVNLGTEAILGVLTTHHAATVRELEARASERIWGSLGYAINPHHLTEARRALEAQGRIVSTTRQTRGHDITMYHLPLRYGLATVIAKTSARKRLLNTRFLGWARATKRHPRGLIGPAGEAAVTDALTRLAGKGYTPATGIYGETDRLLNMTVPGGSLDNAAFLTLPDAMGRPTAYTVPIEVKNRRAWIYARSRELHQFLYKAARLQEANPDTPIVPVLVCRRRQESTRRLGMATGFYSVQYHTQLVKPLADIDREHFAQVQTELGYVDLRLSETANARLMKALGDSVTRDAAKAADRWRTFAPVLLPHSDRLRTNLNNHDRAIAYGAMLDDLRDIGAVVPEEE
jgi:hypothetical protein